MGRLAVVVVTVAALLSSGGASAVPVGYARSEYVPHQVAAKDAPYNDLPREARQLTGVVDSSGVRMFKHPDLTSNQLVNHPVAQAQYGLRLLNTYRMTGDPWFLDYATRQAQRLVDTHTESRGAWWFPYLWDFPLGDGTVLQEPWYSQMAQGTALSLFTRLHTITGDTKWSTAADVVWASFLLEPTQSEPWGVWIDWGSHLWLDEYPQWPPDQSERVYNGHIAALYGLYDYWAVTGDTVAADLFDGAATTVARFAPTIRNPGWASDYRPGGTPHERYNAVHVNQLHHLYALTGVGVFADWGDTFHKDFPPPPQSGSLRLAATGHTGIRFDSTGSGKVTARKTIVLTSASSAPFDQRRRIAGQGGYWYRVTAGMLAGYWVLEYPGIRYAKGAVSAVPYFGPRRVVLDGGTHTGYTATGSKTVTFSSGSAAPVSHLGWLHGRLSVLVSAGGLGGYWLPLSSRTTLY